MPATRASPGDRRWQGLLTAKVGDTVTVRAPRGPGRLEIIAIRYDDQR
jgi:transcription elongation GreA/GreB family factor